MDWRTLVAIVLMVVVYFFTFPPAPPTQKPADTNQTTEVSSEAKSVTQSASTAASPQIKAASPGSDEALRNQILKWASEERVIETPELIAKMNALGELRSVSFRQYPVEPKSKELVSRDFSKIGGFNRAVLKAAGVEVLWSSQKWTDRGIQLSGRVGSLEIERTIELAKDQYALIAKDSIKNLGTSSAEASLELRISEELVPSKQSGFLMRILKPQTDFQKAVWFQKDSLDYAMFEQISQKRLESTEGLSWAGFSDKYFLYGLIPQNSSFKNLDLRNVGGRIEQQAEMMPKQIAPAEKMDFEYTYYIGPKKISDLEEINPTLSRAIEYGNWIGPISRGLLAILHFFYSLVHNYGIAIILLTLLVKIVLLPLAYKSAVSMRKLSLVQPKMMEIREKYKKDPQRMNVEMMNLYRTEKVNPVGGCLPMLLQMPVFFALYRVFFASIEMRHAPFFGWLNDLAHYDHFFILPVAMTVLMVLQQKLTPMPETGQDSEAIRIQKAMFKWMPIIFGAIMLFLPAGLTLYFLVNAALSIIQQLLINKRLEILYPRKSGPQLQVVNGS